jgi:hypothetical protein
MRLALWAVFATAGVFVGCGPGGVGPDVPDISGPVEHSGPRAELGRCFDSAAPVTGALNEWRGGGAGVVDLSAAITAGDGLDRKVIARTLRRQAKAFMRCYDVYRRIDPTLHGVVEVSFTIGADGRVSNVDAEGVSTEVAACVADVLSRLRFRNPEGGGIVTVNHRLDLRPPGAAALPNIPKSLEINTEGPLDKDAIRAVIRDAEWSIQYCYESVLMQNPHAAGTVMAEFTIASDGTVTQSVASGVDPYVDECVAATIGTLVFPREPGGVVNVRYPFVFDSVAPPGAKSADQLGLVTFDIDTLRPHVQGASRCFVDHAPADGFGSAVVDISFIDGTVADVSVDSPAGDAAAKCVREALGAVAIEGAGGEIRCDVAYGWERVAPSTPVVDVGSSVRYEGVVVADTFEAEAIAPLSTALVARRSETPDGGIFVVRTEAGATFGSVWRASLTAYAAGYSALRLERAATTDTELIYSARAPLLDLPASSDAVISVVSVLVGNGEVQVGAAGVEPRYLVSHLDGPEAPGLISETLSTLRVAAGDTPLLVVEVAAAPDTAFEHVARVIQLVAGVDGADMYLVLPNALTTPFELVESGDEVEARAPQ